MPKGFLLNVLDWFLTKTIIGPAIIAGLIFVLLTALRRMFPKIPQPVFIAGSVFVVTLFTVPSLPRYRFEREVMSNLEGKDWMRVVNMTKWGDLTEPLTWFRAPVGSVTIVMPHDPIEADTFRRIVLRYGEKPKISVVEPNCRSLTIIYAEPDAKGVVRYTTERPLNMSDDDKKWYCESDWSKEREALRNEALRQMEDRSPR